MTCVAHSLKACSMCKREKPATLEFFHSEKSKKSGLNPACKECANARGKLYRRRGDRDRRMKTAKEYCRVNRETLAQKKREWRARMLADPVRREKEKQRIRMRLKDPRCRKLMAVVNRRFYLESRCVPEKRIQGAIRNAVSNMLRGRAGACGAFRHLPYTVEDLKEHLERQFVRRMSWENYGEKWHVDHIIPVASFKINASDPKHCPEFQACWALSNLRPLWKLDNLAKHAKRIHLV